MELNVRCKKITSSDVKRSIVRRNWSNGTVFDMYRHDYTSSNTATSGASDLYDSTFYFMTSDFRVYKVLDNNGGSFSGSEPTSESTSPFASGGYVLKYMYKVSTSDFAKFGTTDFIPVATDSTVSAALQLMVRLKVFLLLWFWLHRWNLLCSSSRRWNKSRNKFWCNRKNNNLWWFDSFFWINCWN